MALSASSGNFAANTRNPRTALDYARVVRHLCDEVHPDAQKIVLVQDNLNIRRGHPAPGAYTKRLLRCTL